MAKKTKAQVLKEFKQQQVRDKLADAGKGCPMCGAEYVDAGDYR